MECSWIERWPEGWGILFGGSLSAPGSLVPAGVGGARCLPHPASPSSSPGPASSPRKRISQAAGFMCAVENPVRPLEAGMAYWCPRVMGSGFDRAL